MIGFIGKLLVSFLITNWIYSEIALTFPPVQAMGQRFFEVVKIPTHNEWPDIATSAHAEELGEQLESMTTRDGQGFFADSGLLARWNSSTSSLISTVFRGDRDTAEAPAIRRSNARFVFSIPSIPLDSFSGELVRF